MSVSSPAESRTSSLPASLKLRCSLPILKVHSESSPPPVIATVNSRRRSSEFPPVGRNRGVYRYRPVTSRSVAVMTLTTWPEIPPISRLAPSTTSSRMTLSTESRSSAAAGPFDLPDTRRPLISTLVSACPNPRSSPPSSRLKPGTCLTKSSADRGTNCEKSSG